MIRRPPRSTLLSLHDALPISLHITLKMPSSVNVGSHPPRSCLIFSYSSGVKPCSWTSSGVMTGVADRLIVGRSEEHTSELQSRLHLVCRLLLEKKKI